MPSGTVPGQFQDRSRTVPGHRGGALPSGTDPGQFQDSSRKVRDEALVPASVGFDRTVRSQGRRTSAICDLPVELATPARYLTVLLVVAVFFSCFKGATTAPSARSSNYRCVATCRHCQRRATRTRWRCRAGRNTLASTVLPKLESRPHTHVIEPLRRILLCMLVRLCY